MMFHHTIFVEQKSERKRKRKIKRLQTANNTLLGVSPIYKVRTHTTYIKTAANVIFEGCKGAKIGKTNKSI
jgi:hypothetical protein